MSANLIEMLMAEAAKACDEHADLMRAAADALAQAEAEQKQDPLAWRYALDASVNGPRWIYIEKDPMQWLHEPGMANALIQALYAAPQPAAPAVPAGYKLVPVDPTKEMLDAAGLHEEVSHVSLRTAWDEMLAAAPEVK